VQDIEPTFLVFPHVKNRIKKTYFYASPYTPEKSMIAYIVSLILSVSLFVCTPMMSIACYSRHGGICILPLAHDVFISIFDVASYNHSIYTQLAYTISPPNEVFVLTATRSLSLDSSYLPLRSISLVLIYSTYDTRLR
jgi:hypothetical protein